MSANMQRTKLTTPDLASIAPPIGATEDERDPVAVAKFFSPDSRWEWFLTEYDPDTHEAFGLVHGAHEEIGFFNLAQLETIRGPFGMLIKRDPNWKPRRISEVKWS